jgi:hypothetical protein
MPSITPTEQHTQGRRVLRVAAAVLAGAAHLVLGFFSLATGLFAPPWAIVGFAVVWLAAGAALLRMARRGSPGVLLVPVGYAAFLFAAAAMGERWLGWTA